MLRHSAGYKLAGDGHDTRSIQDYLGHRDIRHTVRYTELSPKPFRDFWRAVAALAGFVAEVIEKIALAPVSTAAKILRLCIVCSLRI